VSISLFDYTLTTKVTSGWQPTLECFVRSWLNRLLTPIVVLPRNVKLLQNLHPHLNMTKDRIYAQKGQKAFHLPRVIPGTNEKITSWRSLRLRGENLL
jgi:hypothetical protein